MEKNNNKQNNIKTTTFNAQVAVSKTESGMDYGSLSFSTDGYDRVIFTVPADMRAYLPKVLRKGIKEIINYLKEEGYSL